MEFFTEGVNVMKNLVILIGAGLGVWGAVNLMEGYGNDNPGAKSQGMKQFMAGVGIVLIAMMLIPKLTTLFVVK
ncbi:Maff2 family mobile element protein [Lysinibacillus xylanilyticus]|uniref:Maff2 family mobile element protein n=1 Tax=Lysinibacillus xylanilyticus TaxID=582475 RepID=UPI003D08E94A